MTTNTEISKKTLKHLVEDALNRFAADGWVNSATAAAEAVGYEMVTAECGNCPDLNGLSPAEVRAVELFVRRHVDIIGSRLFELRARLLDDVFPVA